MKLYSSLDIKKNKKLHLKDKELRRNIKSPQIKKL